MRKVTAVFSKTLTYLFLLIVAVFAVFPVIYILLGSFKSNTLSKQREAYCSERGW